MGSLLKNILILGGLAVIAAVGYYLFVIERDATVEGNNEIVTDQAEQQNRAFLRRLEDLRQIELSTTIFSDPRFNSFVDFTEPVEPTSYGRENPFVEQ